MATSSTRVSFWQDPKKRGQIFQILALLAVGLLIYTIYTNIKTNLDKQNIASGFEFLSQEAGFEISETSIEYWSDDSYQKALLVGILNTLKIAFWGNLFAILLGTLIGIARLSKNWLVAKISSVYIEVLRNIPLLLQLFFWYALFTEVFPDIREASSIGPHLFFTNRGFYFPLFQPHPIWFWVLLSVGLGIMATFFMRLICLKKGEKEGRRISALPFGLIFIFLLPLCIWLFGGAPSELDIPALKGFNFQGGHSFTPEFLSLMLGLILYTSAFVAEIVRAGIVSVSNGQWEAAKALGLSSTQSMRLIILPQAFRVIIPPVTSQLLNLTKNSSLAVGIGYPDFVSVANTTMNQTGQAIEAVLLIMGVYLFFSLLISLIMNLYNARMALMERK